MRGLIQQPDQEADPSAGGYGFLTSPRWLIFTFVMAGLIVGMICAASWQWSRHREVQAFNATLIERSALPPVPLDELIDIDDSPGSGDEIAYRRAEISGVLRAEDQVLIRQRTNQGQPGVWAVVPLELDGGGVVLMSRGWFPSADGSSVADPLATADGSVLGERPVEVVGRVLLTQPRGVIGPTDPADGNLDTLARVDVERIGAQIEGPLYPVWIQLESSAPDDVSTGIIVEAPDPDPGSHLSYTGQWSIFTAFAAAGWFIVVRRHRRSLGSTRPTPDHGNRR